MDDAAVRAGHTIQGNAKIGGIQLHLFDLRGRHRVCNRERRIVCRDGMIERGDGFVGVTDRQPALAQAGEGLR